MDTAPEKPDLLLNLQSIPIFSSCSPMELVRLLPHVEERQIAADQYLFRAATPAIELYYVLNGQVEVSCGDRAVRKFSEGFCGEEAAVGANNYLGDVKATVPTTVWAIPAVHLKAYLGKNIQATREFFNSLFAHYTDEKNLFLPKAVKEKSKDKDRLPTSELIGWILAVVLPALTWFGALHYGMEVKARLFLMVFASITVMWVFRLLAEFIPCILGVLALLVLGVAPPADILQGFSSGEFFMAMSIFGVGAVLVTSGLTFRIVLLLLKFIPASPFFHAFAMMVFGVFMTPVLPSANGRVSLVGPIMVDLLGTLDYKKGGKAATMIANATFTGFTLFASVFLTSKPINFVVYGLLPAQVQEEFQWGGWFLAAAVSGLVMFGLVLFYLLVLGRSEERPNLSLQHINAQLQMLGPLSNMEWTSLIAVFVFILGTGISSIHKVDPPWIALAVLTLLLALNALRKNEFHEKVDWSFILYLAGLIGLVKTMSSVGIDSMIAKNLSSVGDLMRADFGMFVVKLFFTMLVVRLILPNNATIAMFCTILLPMAQINGVNPWVIGYIILTFSDGWLFPYQCTYYLLFLETTEGSGYYERREMLKFQILTNVFRIAAIFASIPYWRWLGIIG